MNYTFKNVTSLQRPQENDFGGIEYGLMEYIRTFLLGNKTGQQIDKICCTPQYQNNLIDINQPYISRGIRRSLKRRKKTMSPDATIYLISHK